MGGAAAEPTGKGGKKSLDANINLVPYIDMLMTIMTFLMMTAVWTEIAMLEVQNASGGAEAQPEEPDPNKPKAILVLAGKEQVVIQEEGGEPDTFPKTIDGVQRDLIKNKLTQLKNARPERAEVKVQAEDGVQYEVVSMLIDLATGTNKDKAACDEEPVPGVPGETRPTADMIAGYCGMKQITLTPIGQ
jgi:biopolymer transport protein ExbD